MISSIKKYLVYAAKLLEVLGFFQSISFLGHRLKRTDLIQVEISGLPHPVYCRPTGTDINVLWQVFCSADRKFVDELSSPRLIVDAGTHAGFFSLFCLNRFPGIKMIAIEPSLSNLEMARMNCKDYSNITFVHGAVWNSNSSVFIENPRDEAWAFRVKENSPISRSDTEGDERENSSAIPAYTLEGILEKFDVQTVDLIKIDIEGAEKQVFLESGDDKFKWIAKCNALLIEIHEEETGLAIQEVMKEQDFSLQKLGEKLFYSR